MKRSMEKSEIAKRNKATICATVSPWLKERIEKTVRDGDSIASTSDLVSLACQEFLVRYFPEGPRKKKEAEE